MEYYFEDPMDYHSDDTCVDCPHCDDELVYEEVSDLQGEGAWAMTVYSYELKVKNCDCEISSDEWDTLDKEVEEKNE